MIADREEGFDVYEFNDDGVKEGLIFNENAGGVQAVRHTLADIFKAIQDQIATLGMGKNWSIIVYYDKLTVLKRLMHSKLILLIICDTDKNIDFSSLYDVAHEIEDNFEEIDKIIEKIER